MKDLDQLIGHIGAWLVHSGPMNDVVISSRVRLARNLAGFPFLLKSDESQRKEIHRTLYETVLQTSWGPKMVYVDVEKASALDRQLMVERNLISRQLAEIEGSRGVAFLPEETMSLMINEEDHLRMQVIRSGLQLAELWQEIDAIDNDLLSKVDFAFHEQYGFLTACPTNVGTGIRVSVMLHLPALKLAGELEKVSHAAKDMHLAVRGLHGEGTEATGDFYQVSNQTTLGRSESEIIHEFNDVIIPRIVEYERLARQVLLKDRQAALDDKIWRAYGVLENARTMSTEETLFLLSHLRMGVNMGRLSNIPIDTINDLFLRTQPAHLQKMSGSILDGEARSIARADYIRKRLASDN